MIHPDDLVKRFTEQHPDIKIISWVSSKLSNMQGVMALTADEIVFISDTGGLNLQIYPFAQILSIRCSHSPLLSMMNINTEERKIYFQIPGKPSSVFIDAIRKIIDKNELPIEFYKPPEESDIDNSDSDDQPSGLPGALDSSFPTLNPLLSAQTTPTDENDLWAMRTTPGRTNRNRDLFGSTNFRRKSYIVAVMMMLILLLVAISTNISYRTMKKTTVQQFLKKEAREAQRAKQEQKVIDRRNAMDSQRILSIKGQMSSGKQYQGPISKLEKQPSIVGSDDHGVRIDIYGQRFQDIVDIMHTDSKGRILAAGYTSAGPDIKTDGTDAVIIRFTPDGRLDPTFGNSGGIVIRHDRRRNENEMIGAIVVSRDDSIVAAATSGLFRILPDGSADMHFGINGSIRTHPMIDLKMGKNDTLFGLTPDGFIIKHKRNGSLETGFGKTGKTDLQRLFKINAGFTRLAIQPDGFILAAGTASNRLLIVRMTPSGKKDPSFGQQGRVIIDAGNVEQRLTALVIQPDGKIVAGATGCKILRLLADGKPDTAFAENGMITSAGESFGPIVGISVLNDGRLFISGGDGTTGIFGVRLFDNGALDFSFSGSGIFFAETDAPYVSSGHVILPDKTLVFGSVVKAGYVKHPGGVQSMDYDFKLMRIMLSDSLSINKKPSEKEKIVPENVSVLKKKLPGHPDDWQKQINLSTFSRRGVIYGLLFKKVQPDSFFAQAGIEKGDLLISINGTFFPSEQAFQIFFPLIADTGLPMTFEIKKAKTGEKMYISIETARQKDPASLPTPNKENR